MNTLAFIQNINGPELILIFFVVLLFFGAERMPGLFRSFGKSMREFKKATKGIEEDIRSAMDEEPERPARTAKTETSVSEEAASETKTSEAGTTSDATVATEPIDSSDVETREKRD